MPVVELGSAPASRPHADHALVVAHAPASWLDRTLQRVTTPDDAVLFALLVLLLGFGALGWLTGRAAAPDDPRA
ncbi:MAG: hypothetical protein K1X88_24400 [Nannocystaceae bacterium]|nr:hypothetical protein [Nannocystaceae bacterium]